MYKYNSKIKLGKVELNVLNLEAQTQYYVNAIGLSVINKSENQVDLGLEENGQVLIRLNSVKEDGRNNFGLYHLALLLPSREDLGNLLYHFINTQTPLIGASNHGYSEAVYLEDPEENGIEIYRDRDMTDWDIKEDGQIIGITEAMDVEGVLAVATQKEGLYKLPNGTTMGHVHLSVKNSLSSSEFYNKLFELENKMVIPSASWIAAGDYHHHIAVNNWEAMGKVKREVNKSGLASFDIETIDEQYFDKVSNYANDLGKLVKNIEKVIEIEDPDGIHIKLKLANK